MHLTVSQFKGRRGFLDQKGKGCQGKEPEQPEPRATSPAPSSPPIHPSMGSQEFFQKSAEHAEVVDFIEKCLG